MDTLLPAVQFIANASSQSLDEYGRSPLHYCCQIPAPGAIDILLSLRHFDVNHQDCLGHTPLVCLLHGYSECSREFIHSIAFLLLRNGADPNICGSFLTPLMLAVIHKDVFLVQLLLQFGANPNVRLDDSESLLIPARSSALSLAVRPPLNSILTETDIHIIWYLIQYTSPATIFHAIQKVDKSVKTIVLTILGLIQSKPYT
jgi:ankyrin repeat protein